MPRDWRNDPEAIRRYCVCDWLYADVVTPVSEFKFDSQSPAWNRVYTSPQCPLHGDDPKHDLPPEFP